MTSPSTWTPCVWPTRARGRSCDVAPEHRNVRRSVETPEHVWSTVEQAARWLGFSVDEFRGMVKAHADRLPHSEAVKAHRWHWRVLVAFSWWLETQQSGRPEQSSEKT